MADKAGSLELLAREMGRMLEPLQETLSSDAILDLFADLGVQFPPQLLNQAGFTNALNAGSSAAAALPALIDQLSTDIDGSNIANIILHSGQLIQQILAVSTAIDQLASQLQAASGSLPGISAAEVSDFAQHLATNLLDFMIVTYLETWHKSFASVMALIGLIEHTPNPGTPGDPTKPIYTIKKLHLERLGDLLKSPTTYAQNLYAWGSPGFDGTALLTNVDIFLSAFAIPSKLQPPAAGAPLTLESFLFRLQPNPATSPPGLLLELHVPIEGGFDLIIPISDRWSVHVTTSGQFAADLKATAVPPAQVTLSSPTGTVTGQFQAEFAGDGTTSPFVLLGLAGGPQIEVASIKFAFGIAATLDATSGQVTGGLTIKASVSDGHVRVAASDSFLSKIFGDSLDAKFNLAVGWSLVKGLMFEGSAGIETALSLHQSIGPFVIDTLHIGLGVSATGLPAEVSISGSGALGPLAVSVDRIGVLGELKFQRGNLGPVDFGVRFKPPRGLGLLIDAGAVTGGGFIFLDPDKGQYAGVLELKLETIQIKAIGILDTKLPDGSKGFSFLIIITAEFSPIQLGFGFTLIGVGGLAGINRTMVLEVLRSGLRNHTLNSILFPPDPVRNAPQIISDLRAIFPPAEGRYVFGPMIEIGWGTPTIISASLGVLLELPSPVRLALLGQIKAVLPTDDAALILLHIDILGIVDFGAKYLSLDGTIYDSRIVVFSLLGDMALRLNWGDNPNFLCSIGGFHPRFQPPAGFPTLHRLMVSVGYGDYIRMSLSSYQAFTSNTVQFGASFDLRVDFAGFRIHGYFSFDALFIFTPFSFIAEMQAGVELSFEGLTLFSIHLDLMLSGPTPWHAHGTASIDILFFSISVSVDITFGDARQVTVPGVSPVQPLLDALNDARNWSAALPEGAEQAVSLTAAKVDEKVILMHPMGLLTVRQTVVPLGITITKFGEAAPAEADKLDIASVTFGQGTQNEIAGDEPDHFASAHFFTLSDGQKLAAPSYSQMKAGVKVGAADIEGTDASNVSNLQLSYDTFIVDDLNVPGTAHDRYSPTLHTMLAHNHQGAAELSLVRATGNAKYVVPGTVSAVKLAEPQYVVASTEDLTISADVSPAGGASYFAATVALHAHLAANPEKAGLLQVVPLHEV